LFHIHGANMTHLSADAPIEKNAAGIDLGNESGDKGRMTCQ
jgi:hypothetical protein